MSENTKKWNDETTAKLKNLVSGVNQPIPASVVAEAAAELNTSERSVAAKLRQLDYTVASMAKEKVPTFSEEQTDALRQFVESNAGKFTYKEIAENFASGEFNAKQVQGKLLALELTSMVKPTEKVEAARLYSEAEELKFVSMAKSGKFIEEIAEALGKSIASVRGKALSLTRNGQLDKIPAQKQSHAKDVVDAVSALGDSIHTMTVAAIAAAVDKTERGVRTLLTRRGIKVADYDGKAKKEKAQAKAGAQ